MPNWILDIAFYALLAIGVAYPVLASTAIIDFAGKLTRKSPEPPKVYTPAEMKARDADMKATVARFAAMRAANGQG